MNKVGQLFSTILVMLMMGVGLGCKGEELPAKAVVRPVRAIKVGDIERITGRSFPGHAKATREVELSFRVAGPLISRSANVGDDVKKGQVLGRIDPRDYEVNVRNIEGQLAVARANLAAMRQSRPEEIRRLKASVRKSEAALKLAKTEYDRVMRIKAEDPGAVSKSMVDQRVEQKDRADSELREAIERLRIGEAGARVEDIQAKEAEIRSLRASVASAKDHLRYTYLRAPFDGTIVTTYVENFEDVRAKQPILRLVDTSRIEMIVNIPETLISFAPQVEKVWVRFDPFPDKEIEAKVKEIGTEASETTRTYPVTLIMEQPEEIKILPGMAGKTIRAEGPLPNEATQGGIEVPVSATFSPDNSAKAYVWIIDEKTKAVRRREVKTGILTDRGIKINAGLKTGEWVATAGVHYLREGQKVRILQEKGQ